MLTIILLSIITIIGFVGGWLIDKYTYADGWSFGFYGTGTLCAVALACFLLALINIDRRIQNTVYRYEYISRMVESYDGQDYGNMGSLVEAVVDMNSTIATNKAQYDSKWMGLWYSEKIANLEPITFGKKVQDVPALE
jgi:hypothetical protein